MGVCRKERKGVTAEVLMATPCTNSLGGESGGQKHEGCGGRSAWWKYATGDRLDDDAGDDDDERRKTKKDKERQKRKEIDVRWWPQEPESGGEAQARARLARDCGLPLPKTCEARVVA